jgi:Family of unknown function (DUF6932)
LATGTLLALVFNDRKLLSPGVHDATLDEVEQHFARFQKSDRRLKLFRNLRDYLAAVKKAGCGTAVILDGSFVMGCVDEPGDIDLILVLPPDWDTTAELKPYQYNLVSRKRVKKDYRFDLAAVRQGSKEEKEWTAFFSEVDLKWCRQFGWPEGSTKGIVRITL